MKLESIKSSKFEAFKTIEIADQKLIFGGRPECTGGGFSLVDVVPDKDGARGVYKAWDSDTTGSTLGQKAGGTGFRYFNDHTVLGACSANW